MAYSEAMNKAIQRYDKKTYDRIALRVPKGRKEFIQSRANEKGQSLNGYINDLINNDIDKEDINND